eukprot:SAG31_NODE_50802_length_107_cov_24.125000_1_plen_23_part_10
MNPDRIVNGTKTLKKLQNPKRRI